MATTFTQVVDGMSVTSKLSTDVVKAEVLLDLTSAELSSAVSGDTIQCLKIPENAIVTKVGWYTILKDTTATGTLGDGDTADGWDAAVDFTTTGNNGFSTEGTDTFAPGKFYTSADTIDVVLGADNAGTGKVMIFAHYSVAANDLA